MSSTRVYSIWRTMKNRCLLKTDPFYHAYGARGIKVCARWLESFENFYADMGDPPSADHSIDRRDGNGDYEPGNCRWATVLEQANNRSSNRLLRIGEETASLAEWSRRTGIAPSTIRERLVRGWSPERALNLQEEYNARTP